MKLCNAVLSKFSPLHGRRVSGVRVCSQKAGSDGLCSFHRRRCFVAQPIPYTLARENCPTGENHKHAVIRGVMICRGYVLNRREKNCPPIRVRPKQEAILRVLLSSPGIVGALELFDHLYSDNIDGGPSSGTSIIKAFVHGLDNNLHRIGLLVEAQGRGFEIMKIVSMKKLELGPSMPPASVGEAQ